MAIQFLFICFQALPDLFIALRSSSFLFRTQEILTDLCWGKRVLDKVVKWDAPMKLGDWQETHVTYTFKIENLAEWAKNPEVQEAFPSIKKTIEGDKELGLNVHLTSEGWEAGRRGF